MLKTIVLLLSVIKLATPQSVSSISASIFCQASQDLEDNLSCSGNTCFRRNELCNGVNFCVDGIDEGVGISLLSCGMDRGNVYLFNQCRLKGQAS